MKTIADRRIFHFSHFCCFAFFNGDLNAVGCVALLSYVKVSQLYRASKTINHVHRNDISASPHQGAVETTFNP